MTSPSEPGARHSPELLQAGFSLVEMLVVLAILSLVAAFAAPLLRDPSGRRALDGSAREIAALFREAGAEAVLSGSNAVVVVSLDNNEVSAGWTETKLSIPRDMALTVLTAREELVSSQKPSFRFFADGSATGGAIRLQTPDAEVLVSVDWLTGRVEHSSAVK